MFGDNKKMLLALAVASVAPSVAGQGGQNESFALEEVIVTAQKREQTLQEVPISITALTADALEINSIVDTNSFADLVPNLHIKQGVGGDITLGIRGATQNLTSNIGFEAAVGQYMDGVYFGKGLGTLFDLGDVERIEVLRGPQGTLYGRNTIGGAVNFITAKPTGELSGKLKVGVGNSDLLNTYGVLNTGTLGTADQGLGQLSARVSYFSRERDGFTKIVQHDYAAGSLPAVNVGGLLGDIDREGLRLSLNWQIRDYLSADYSYSQSDIEDTPRLFQVIDVVAGAVEPGFENYILDDDKYPSRGSLNHGVGYQTDIDSHIFTLSWDVSEDINLKAITGYFETETNVDIDIDGSNTSFNEDNSTFEHEQFSQELQLTASFDRVELVTGLFYFDEEAESARAQKFVGGALFRRKGARSENSNEAIYGQLDWDLTERLTLSVGGRHTRETKQMDRYILNFFGDPTQEVKVMDHPYDILLPEIDFNDTSYMASVSYAFTDSINTYAKYSEGFRSGGYDGSTASAMAAEIPFDSEELKAVEVGIKSDWLESRVQANLALFFNDYTDIQLSSWDGTVTRTQNAGEAETSGGELEITVLPIASLRASLNIAYLDVDIQEFDMGSIIGDVAENAEFNNAPPFSYNLGVDYSFGAFDFGQLDLHLNYNYSDGAHAVAIKSNGDAPNSRTSDRHLLDARLALSQIELGSGMEAVVALWGKNLTDETYYDNVVDFGSFRTGTLGWPRTYGIEASLTF